MNPSAINPSDIGVREVIAEKGCAISEEKRKDRKHKQKAALFSEKEGCKETCGKKKQRNEREVAQHSVGMQKV